MIVIFSSVSSMTFARRSRPRLKPLDGNER
jgi:hypothetical protein